MVAACVGVLEHALQLAYCYNQCGMRLGDETARAGGWTAEASALPRGTL
jgi:hypothetical protein